MVTYWGVGVVVTADGFAPDWDVFADDEVFETGFGGATQAHTMTSKTRTIGIILSNAFFIKEYFRC